MVNSYEKSKKGALGMIRKSYFIVLFIFLINSLFIVPKAQAKDIAKLVSEVKADPYLSKSQDALALLDEFVMCAARINNASDQLSYLASNKTNISQAKMDLFNHAAAVYVFYKKHPDQPIGNEVNTGLPSSLSNKIIGLLKENKDKEAVDALVKFGTPLAQARDNVREIKNIIQDKLDGRLSSLLPLASAIKTGNIKDCYSISERPCRINCMWFFGDNYEDTCSDYLKSKINSSGLSSLEKERFLKIISG